MIANRILKQDFDILITSYEMCMREKSTMKRFSIRSCRRLYGRL